MHAQVRDWVEALPNAFGQLQQDSNGMRNPLFRWLAREVKLGSELLELVRAQLGAVLAVCAGTAKPTTLNAISCATSPWVPCRPVAALRCCRHHRQRVAHRPGKARASATGVAALDAGARAAWCVAWWIVLARSFYHATRQAVAQARVRPGQLAHGGDDRRWQCGADSTQHSGLPI